MAKKKKKYGQYAATCVVAAAIGLGAYAFLSDFELGDLSLPFVSGTDGNITTDDRQTNNNDTTTNDDPDANQNQPGGQEGDGNEQNLPGDVPLRIEVYNDRIIFDGNDISLEDLETILQTHGNDTDVWELVDAHQASATVYSAVVGVFQRHNVMFAER